MTTYVEGDAALVLRTHGQDEGEPPRLLELVKRALGVGVQTVHAWSLPGDAALATVHGQRRIYVRRGLPPERLRWAIAHELGHWALGLDSSTRENEDACDAFAAALLVPHGAFRSALKTAGSSYTKLARHFVTTESCAALRFGEVTGVPLALVAPARVRLRGDGHAWPGEEALRSLAKEPRVPGVRKVRLRDDARRVALRVS